MNNNNNGNGHSNGNGKEPTPAEKAWETARQIAREQGQSVRDQEIRCIKTKGLSCWAKLLFWILSKICWETSAFLHERRVGSVCITSRQLELHFSFPKKRLYAQTKKKKDANGNVIASRKVAGAIEELERAGLVWMSHKAISNIPPHKWPNVFNVVALVPFRTQASLGLLEDVVVADEHDTNGGVSDFSRQNGGGNGQSPQNGLAKHQRATLPDTNGGTSQGPRAALGQHQRGDLANTNGGVSADTNGGVKATPTGGTGKHHSATLPGNDGGTPIRLSDVISDPPDVPFKRSTGLNAPKGRGGKPKNGVEGVFLLDVGCMMEKWKKGSGRAELESSGAWWRLAFRKSPELMRRVLAEVSVLVKEGKITDNPGAAAVDLAKRWGLSLPATEATTAPKK